MMVVFIICLVSAFLMGVIIGSSVTNVKDGGILEVHEIIPNGKYIVLHCNLDSEELDSTESIKLKVEHITDPLPSRDSRNLPDL